MPTLATQQNHKIACALGQIEEAVRILMAADVAVHAVSIDNNLPYLMTDDALGCPEITPLSRIRHADGLVIYRACLVGCVLQFEVNEQGTEEDQAA